MNTYPDRILTGKVVVDNKGISGGIEIKVTPKGTTNTRTYKIKFIVTESTNSKPQK